MDFDSYQLHATQTDTVRGRDDSLLVKVLGLSGEVGTLQSEYKKFRRDGEKHTRFSERMAEELGDVLWYVAGIASDLKLRLSDIASTNLSKTASRWGFDPKKKRTAFFDDGYPIGQRFPRKFLLEFREESTAKGKQVRIYREGKPIGDPLRDNAYENDGYRFHDVFHLSYAAVLGWSPVMRKVLDLKRTASTTVDEVEDGGRAAVIEEAVAAMVYDYARNHAFLKNLKKVDYDLLRRIKDLTSDREVHSSSYGEWEHAVLAGYSAFHKLNAAGGGFVEADLTNRRVTFMPRAKSPVKPPSKNSKRKLVKRRRIKPAA